MSDKTLVLCDIDGTLHERGGLFAGADRAVALLRSVATIRFMTNTDSTPTHLIARRLEIVAAGARSDPTLHELVQRHQDGWSTVADATTAEARPVSRTYVRLACRVGLRGFKGSDVLRPDHI